MPDSFDAVAAAESHPAPPTESSDPWSQPRTRWIALAVVTAIVAYLCWLVIAPFVDVLLWSVVLVVGFYPLHRRLLARFRSPNLAAACSTVVVIVTILVPLAFVSMILVRDVTRMAHGLEAKRQALMDPDSPSTINRVFGWVDARFGIDRDEAQQYLAQRAKAIAGAFAAKTFDVLGGVLGAMVQIFFVIFTMFYLFRDARRVRETAGGLLPLERWQAADVFMRTKEVIVASLYGSLVIAAIQGTLGGLAFWVLALPSPLLWGVVMILLSMIPMAGAFVVWVPAAIYLISTGHWVKAVILIAWGTLVIGTIDNVLRPKLVGSRTRLHELVVFFAVLGGIQLFGILGVVTGPVLAAVAIALIDVWKQTRAIPTVATVPASSVPESPSPSGPGAPRVQPA